MNLSRNQFLKYRKWEKSKFHPIIVPCHFVLFIRQTITLIAVPLDIEFRPLCVIMHSIISPMLT